MARRNFTQYVHEYTSRAGQVWYAVAEWSQERGQYYAPLDHSTAELTGCTGKFCRSLDGGGMDSYRDRRRALSRARYLFG